MMLPSRLNECCLFNRHGATAAPVAVKIAKFLRNHGLAPVIDESDMVDEITANIREVAESGIHADRNRVFITVIIREGFVRIILFNRHGPPEKTTSLYRKELVSRSSRNRTGAAWSGTWHIMEIETYAFNQSDGGSGNLQGSGEDGGHVNH